MTYKNGNEGYSDGNAISVTPGQQISVTVGKGGIGGNGSGGVTSHSTSGGDSKFDNVIAQGGQASGLDGDAHTPGDGGSGGGYWRTGGSDGNDGESSSGGYIGKGQGHTTRDFGEDTGKRNAGGGGGQRYTQYEGLAENKGGESDYTNGKEHDSSGFPGLAGGGYGGGGGPWSTGNMYAGGGGDGTVLIRYHAWNKGTVSTTVSNYNDELDLPVANEK